MKQVTILDKWDLRHWKTVPFSAWVRVGKSAAALRPTNYHQIVVATSRMSHPNAFYGDSMVANGLHNSKSISSLMRYEETRRHLCAHKSIFGKKDRLISKACNCRATCTDALPTNVRSTRFVRIKTGLTNKSPRQLTFSQDGLVD